MFVAWRDLRHARGRFLLVTAVVALLAVLVGFLSGLTGGLALQNVSAVLALPADRVVVSPAPGDEQVTFAASVVTEAQRDLWASAAGVQGVEPWGISQVRAQAGEARRAVALLGADVDLGAGAPPAPGAVLVSAPAAEALGVGAGDVVGLAGLTLTVDRVVGDDWYSHSPALYVSMADWRAVMAAAGSPDTYATALLVAGSMGSADWAAVDTAAATASAGALGALTFLSSFRSEIGSLLLIVALLFAISALVVGAFFTVWTIQRRPDIAVLRALGADDGALRRDALGQALVLLVAGSAAGTAVVVVAGLAIRDTLPFLLSPLTTVAPAVLLTVVGLVGAALAVRSISSAEPLTALGSNR